MVIYQSFYKNIIAHQTISSCTTLLDLFKLIQNTSIWFLILDMLADTVIIIFLLLAYLILCLSSIVVIHVKYLVEVLYLFAAQLHRWHVWTAIPYSPVKLSTPVLVAGWSYQQNSITHHASQVTVTPPFRMSEVVGLDIFGEIVRGIP